EALTLSGAGAGAVSGGITATGALENVSGTNTYGGLITLSGTAAPTTISSDSGSLSLINTGTITGAGVSLNLAGAGNGSIASVIGTTTGGLSMTGTGTWTLSGNSTYSGGTTVSSGKLYVNNGPSGSGTGTGAVTIGSGAMLAGNGVITPSGGAGVVIQSGGTLSSGAVQVSDATHNTVTPGASGTNGLLFNNAEASSSTLTIAGGANLTFSLGAGTTAGSGALTFNAPNTNSTFFTLTGGTTDQIFGAGAADTINLVDLTAFTPVSLPSQKLQLALQNPYLLIVTTPTGGNANADFANLITSGGEGVNGYVLGVDNGSGVATPFILNMTDNNGNQLSSAGLQLYLYNGELEVIPEPSTWAMLLGGVAMLLFTVRRRARMNS
ncbi:MAG TPA: autotransporter-associated beta strand repeat-containing protein, partial [Steroidobacteraceae bacterium]